MSKLDELIKELCPDGVEYVRLNTICSIYDGTHTTPHYVNSGVKFVSVENINDLYGSKKYISFEDFKKYKIIPQINDIFMTRIGSIGICTVVDRNEPLAYYVSLALLRPNTKVIDSRFLKYSIESLHGRKELRKRTLVNAVPIKVNKDEIGKITVPIPPMEVQREIVRILDNFTELTAELTTELTARKKQYEYYRNRLLTFDMNISEMKLSDVCDYVDYRGKTPVKSDSGVFLVTAKNIKKGYIDYDSSKEYIPADTYDDVMHRGFPQVGDVLITTEAPCGNVAQVDRADIALAQRVIKLRGKTNILRNRYLKFILLSQLFQDRLKKAANGSTVKGIKGSTLLRLSIPVPSLDVQDKIADVLDNFDKVCNDLHIGLPAEIEARKKQYEFYRDSLLTFLEKGESILTEQNRTKVRSD